MIGTSTPHPATDAERARRNARIVAARRSGQTWREIAAEFGLSESQVRKVWADERAAAAAEAERPEATLDVDPARVFAEAVAVHRDVLRKLADLGETADNDSARVGALSRLAATNVQLIGLYERAGVVPPTPDRWLVERDLAVIARTMLGAIERFEQQVDEFVCSAEVAEEIRAEARRVAGVFADLVGIERDEPRALEVAA